MRAHFYESDDPIEQGALYTCLCGKAVDKAFFVFVYYIEGNVLGRSEVKQARGMCRKCMDEGPQKKRFRYGLVNHQEWLDYCAKRKIDSELAESA